MAASPGFSGFPMSAVRRWSYAAGVDDLSEPAHEELAPGADQDPARDVAPLKRMIIDIPFELEGREAAHRRADEHARQLREKNEE